MKTHKTKSQKKKTLKKKKTSQHQKRQHLFLLYSQTNELSLQQIKQMIKQEFHRNYSTEVYNSLMSIWGTTIDKRRVITKQVFVTKLFQKPDGFLRDIQL
tara:strand:- start:260 stop:559 length:300 start_codon:yes stop_codon:yes gene_type:complete